MLLLLLRAFWQQTPAWLSLLLLSIEVVAFNAIIALNGAASNPYNAVLLVPLVLALMLLPIIYSSALLILSIAAQVTQIFLLPDQTHHGTMMLNHSYAMVGSFILTSLLVAAVVCYFHYQIANRENALQKFRERQLRDEQLLAIGTAAAQLTHDVATPAQSIRLLLEEATDQQRENAWLQALDQQFQRIEQQLRNWREVADDVREQRLHQYQVNELVNSLRYLIQIARPEAIIQWQTDTKNSGFCILADRTLLPALTSVIINACEAASNSTSQQIEISTETTTTHWKLGIRNQGNTLTKDSLASLGSEFIPSSHGHGIGAVLTNATIEKFGGEVNWQYQTDIMTTTVSLPLRNDLA